MKWLPDAPLKQLTKKYGVVRRCGRVAMAAFYTMRPVLFDKVLNP
jgi:hypothetical protein